MNQQERQRKILQDLVTGMDATGMLFGTNHPVYLAAKEAIAEEPEEPGSNPNSIEERLNNLEMCIVAMMSKSDPGLVREVYKEVIVPKSPGKISGNETK